MATTALTTIVILWTMKCEKSICCWNGSLFAHSRRVYIPQFMQNAKVMLSLQNYKQTRSAQFDAAALTSKSFNNDSFILKSI